MATNKTTTRKSTGKATSSPSKIMPRRPVAVSGAKKAGTATKATAKKASASTTPAKKATPAKTTKPTVKMSEGSWDSRRQRATDEQIKAHCEKAWANGVTNVWEMRNSAKHTSASASRKRFIPIARAVVESHGGAPVKEKVARKPRATKAGASVERYAVLKTEAAALKAWKDAGEKGKRPETPVTDARNAELAAKRESAKADATKAKTSKTATKVAAVAKSVKARSVTVRV